MTTFQVDWSELETILSGPLFKTINQTVTNEYVSCYKGGYPRTDAYKKGDNLILEMEIPGLAASDISVKTKNNILTVSGNKSSEDTKDRHYFLKELKKSNFTRSFELGDFFDLKGIDPVFKGGKLFITIPYKKDFLEKDKEVTFEIKQ